MSKREKLYDPTQARMVGNILAGYNSPITNRTFLEQDTVQQEWLEDRAIASVKRVIKKLEEA
jgi:hypothetical protein